MLRIVGEAVLVLLLVLPALADDGKSQDKPPRPAEQFKALLKEIHDGQLAYYKAYQGAKSEEERQKIFREKSPSPEDFAPKFLALAEKHPEDPVAVDALVWVFTNQFGKALAILLRDHVTSDKLGPIVPRMGFQIMDPPTETFLRAILDQNPNRQLQADACLGLAHGLRYQVELMRMLPKDANTARIFEQTVGKKRIDALLKQNAAQLDAESEKLFRRFIDKYLDTLDTMQVANMSRMRMFDGDPTAEQLLRAILEKDSRRDIQGVACLMLAQVLKGQAGMLQGEKGEKLRKESEALFERALEKYADVKTPYFGTVGVKAQGELRLVAGKPAPEIEGQDQDGKKFRLSDYKGKVVLLDFWSQF